MSRLNYLWVIGILSSLGGAASLDITFDRCAIAIKKGGLAIIGDRVCLAHVSGSEDLWQIRRTDKGLTIQSRSAQKSGRYLTADAQGRLSLTDKPMDGSYWSFEGTRGDITAEARISVQRRGNGPQYLAAGDEPFQVTDEKGKEYRVYPVKVTDKEGPIFHIGLISP